MGKYIDKIKSFLGLSFQLAIAEFKLKSEGTILGVFWYLLSPLLTFLIMLLIFKDRLGSDIPNYPLYLFMGILLFNFFQKITSQAVTAIKIKAGLIKSIKFQKESIIGGIVIKNIFFHMFEIGILIVFLLIIGKPIINLVFYPIILFLLIIFSFGASLILSSIGTYILDLEEIWNFSSRIIWFATPIFYSIQGQNALLIFNKFNPMYYFITISREIIIYSRFPDTFLIVGTLIYTTLFLVIGLVIFNLLKKRFGELV